MMTNTEMTLVHTLGRSPVEKFRNFFHRDYYDNATLMEVDLGSVNVSVQLGETLAKTIVQDHSYEDNHHLVEVHVFRDPTHYDNIKDRIIVRVDAARFIGTNVLTMGIDEDNHACFFISSVSEFGKLPHPWWSNRDSEERFGIVRVLNPKRKTSTLCHLNQSDINKLFSERTASIDIQYPVSSQCFNPGDIYYYRNLSGISLVFNSKLARNKEFDNGIPTWVTIQAHSAFYAQRVLMEMIS